MDYGTLVPLGDVDFYPNGGEVQPGCSNKKRDLWGKCKSIGLKAKFKQADVDKSILT